MIIILGLGVTAFFLMLTYSCGKDSKGTRGNITIAQLLILLMWTILSIWNIIYVNEFVHEKQINIGYEYTASGTDENPEEHEMEHYWTMDKRDFVLFNFCWGCLMFTLFFYFYMVAGSYEKEAEKKEEDE